MRTSLKTVLFTFIITAVAAGAAFGAVRLKDVARVEGVRENQLFGYGIVVGLDGTGDGVTMTKQTVANMIERLGLTIDVDQINVDNIGAVMVTASLPAFAKPGDTIDVVVSSVGDADSLQGGTLIMTPLKGADGNVYAVAQGAVSIGGWTAGRGGASQSKGHPTVGRIPGGATVEREVPTEVVDFDKIHLSLHNPDFTTASNIVRAINFRNGSDIAKAVDAATIEITPPAGAIDDIVPFIADLENIPVEQDQVSRVVINEKTGTIVMGGDVTISPVAIAHGTLTVKVKPQTDVYLPGPFTDVDEATVVESDDIEAEEKKVAFSRVSTGDVVDALNKMGVTASDIIAILQALKASGALQAEIITM